MAFPVVGFVIATVLVAVYLRLKFGKKGKPEEFKNAKDIPGPTGLPLIGNLHQLTKSLGGFFRLRYPSNQYTKWAKEYGPIYKVKLAQYEVVVISDPKWLKEMFSDLAFSGKPKFDGFAMFLEHPELGMFQSEGELWEVHRRFLLRQLRDFGFGKSAMEALIMDEVKEVMETFKSKQGTPVGEIRDTLRLAVFNSLWTILTSKRFNQNDPELSKLARNTTEGLNEIIEGGSLLVFMPWLRHIFPEATGYNKVRALMEEHKKLFMGEVNEHKAKFNEDDLNDFIDVYLAEMKKTTDPKSTFFGEKAELHLIAMMFDLFFAGSDTTAITTAWTVLYLSKFPEVQKKFQKEIDEITGGLRSPSVDDRPKMPYTVAMIDEVLRFSSLVPDGVQHRATMDKEFHGYHIPKDAWLQPNLRCIHFNPELWDKPEEFRPERFLSPDGKKYVRSENLQAFQVGKRQCSGETLARDTIFLYLTNLYQQFDIKFDPNTPDPGFDAEPGFLWSPKPYKVIMTSRSPAK